MIAYIITTTNLSVLNYNKVNDMYLATRQMQMQGHAEEGGATAEGRAGREGCARASAATERPVAAKEGVHARAYLPSIPECMHIGKTTPWSHARESDTREHSGEQMAGLLHLSMGVHLRTAENKMPEPRTVEVERRADWSSLDTVTKLELATLQRPGALEVGRRPRAEADPTRARQVVSRVARAAMQTHKGAPNGVARAPRGGPTVDPRGRTGWCRARSAQRAGQRVCELSYSRHYQGARRVSALVPPLSGWQGMRGQVIISRARQMETGHRATSSALMGIGLKLGVGKHVAPPPFHNVFLINVSGYISINFAI